MGTLLAFVLLGLLSGAGAVLAGMEASSPEVEAGRRVALSIVAALLTLFTVLLALGLYWMWQFANNFTF
ncbi:MAG TPA: hypothetical protein VJ653_02810 [Acidimicrobiales bacterium]|nr:hypothetical protein [Acidimicrobiales bacterium]